MLQCNRVRCSCRTTFEELLLVLNPVKEGAREHRRILEVVMENFVKTALENNSKPNLFGLVLCPPSILHSNLHSV